MYLLIRCFNFCLIFYVYKALFLISSYLHRSSASASRRGQLLNSQPRCCSAGTTNQPAQLRLQCQLAGLKDSNGGDRQQERTGGTRLTYPGSLYAITSEQLPAYRDVMAMQQQARHIIGHSCQIVSLQYYSKPYVNVIVCVQEKGIRVNVSTVTMSSGSRWCAAIQKS